MRLYKFLWFLLSLQLIAASVLLVVASFRVERQPVAESLFKIGLLEKDFSLGFGSKAPPNVDEPVIVEPMPTQFDDEQREMLRYRARLVGGIGFAVGALGSFFLRPRRRSSGSKSSS